MYKENLNFSKNGKFKIMQVADIQEEATVSPDTINLLRLAIEKENPDLAIMTGDQFNGISPTFFTGDIYRKFKNTADAITAPFEEAGIPYAVTFGNHDEQIGIKKSEQADLFSLYPHCIKTDYRSEEDKGTFRLPLYFEDKHIFDIYVFDSNADSPQGGYEPVHKEQLLWFKEEREKAKEEDYTKSIVFQHIPVPEYYNVLKKVSPCTKGAVEAFRTHKHEFFILPDEIKDTGGFMYEYPAVPDNNSGEFSVLKEKGNVLGLFVGHDHRNSFVSDYQGIKLVYTQCSGFNVYGPHYKRGVRIIELDVKDLSGFSTHTVTYGELTDKKLNKPLKEFILTHIPTSREKIKRLIVFCGAGAAAVGTAGAVLLSKKLKEK